MRILVTGGAGYIGSFMTKRLLDDGHEVVVADNLVRGHRMALPKNIKMFTGDLLDEIFVESIFRQQSFDAVIHFAGYISMEESVKKPGLYFANNVFSVINLLNKMRQFNSNNFIFSSTAGVYGDPIKIPIPEGHPTNPKNPYGESKLMAEKILSWYRLTYEISFVSLRYFNASGAALDGSMGEDHSPETHIIPNAIKAVISNEEFILFGNDYNTKDGTCVRDYIHVLDLIEAHVLAIQKLKDSKGGFFYNVGAGLGYSNNEVLDMVEQISGKELKIKIESRRPGDAEILVADPTKIEKELSFSPKYSDLGTIVESAWKWHTNHPIGYES